MLVGICLFGILVAKIYSKQIIQNAYYLSLADQQHLWQEEQKARRGQIYDVNGYPLAANLMMPALEVIPNQVDDVDYTTKKLAAVLHMTRQE